MCNFEASAKLVCSTRFCQDLVFRASDAGLYSNQAESEKNQYLVRTCGVLVHLRLRGASFHVSFVFQKPFSKKIVFFKQSIQQKEFLFCSLSFLSTRNS